jgi:hypothetical protein
MQQLANQAALVEAVLHRQDLILLQTGLCRNISNV